MQSIACPAVTEWFVSHITRRTVATLLDEQGLSARAIADQLGPRLAVDVSGRLHGSRIASDAAAARLRGPDVVRDVVREPFPGSSPLSVG
jgi:integrase